MKYFSKKDLPFNDEMLKFWNENGYLVIEDFNSEEECDKIIERSSYLIDNSKDNQVFNYIDLNKTLPEVLDNLMWQKLFADLVFGEGPKECFEKCSAKKWSVEHATSW